jgi:hypothetical protein
MAITGSRLKNYYKFVWIITAVIFALLSLAFISTLFILIKFNFLSNWFRIFDDNWIILFFKMNIGLVQRESLSTLHMIDFILMILFGFMFIAFFLTLKSKNLIFKLFSIFALIGPYLGMILLFTTHSGGRTGLLTGSLIFSILMLINKKFGILTAIIGILANLTILVSCDIFSLNNISKITSISIVIGYILWLLWFFLVSNKYYQFSKIKENI